MMSFGKKLRERREAKGFSQSKLAQEAELHHSIIGRYERDEAKPTIDIVKRMAKVLDTTVDYLLGETEDMELFKDPTMLKRLKDIQKLDEQNKSHILSVLDRFLQSVKIKNVAAL